MFSPVFLSLTPVFTIIGPVLEDALCPRFEFEPLMYAWAVRNYAEEHPQIHKCMYESSSMHCMSHRAPQ